MNDSTITFEVEVRCYFKDPAEAYDNLPFLRSSIDREIIWTTRHYGRELFRAGQLLRMSEVSQNGKLRYYLGWKGIDLGRTANIRQEIDEEITEGIEGSAVLNLLGGNDDIATPDAARLELERLGHREFMSFHGRNQLGYDPDLGIGTKLMYCPDLSREYLVELEKTARTEQEAFRLENELKKLCAEFEIIDRLIREEPPTLLYHRLFGTSDDQEPPG